MGQLIQKPHCEFPKNLTVFPPCGDACRGPGLVEDLSARTRDIFPKCLQGVHIKVKRRLPGPLDVGYSMIFSTITPSGGQFSSTFSDKSIAIDLNMAPCGAFALQFNKQITRGISVDLETQIHMKRSSVALASVKYSAGDVSTALTFGGCSIPATTLLTSSSPSVFDNKVTHGVVGVQGVYRINKKWAVGSEIILAKGIKVVVSRSSGKSYFGVSADCSGWQTWMTRRITPRFQVAGVLDLKCSRQLEGRLDEVRSAATLGGYWRYSGTQIRTSYSSSGVVACTVKRLLYRSEDTYLTVSLSALLNHTNDKFCLGVSFEGLT